MAEWKESRLVLGDWLCVGLNVRDCTLARVRCCEDEWVVCEVSGVIHAGPFDTREQAMLAAELMFE